MSFFDQASIVPSIFASNVELTSRRLSDGVCRHCWVSLHLFLAEDGRFSESSELLKCFYELLRSETDPHLD